jgi:hypothetical protein
MNAMFISPTTILVGIHIIQHIMCGNCHFRQMVLYYYYHSLEAHICKKWQTVCLAPGMASNRSANERVVRVSEMCGYICMGLLQRKQKQ